MAGGEGQAEHREDGAADGDEGTQHHAQYVGFILATIVFLCVAALPEETLLSWGWRVPFWFSFAVVVLAYVVRRKLEEPEVFVEEQEHDDVAKFPVVELFRTHAADVLRVMLCAFIAVCGTVFSVFGLAFATSHEVGVSKSEMLLVAVSANVLALVMQPTLAILADKMAASRCSSPVRSAAR